MTDKRPGKSKRSKSQSSRPGIALASAKKEVGKKIAAIRKKLNMSRELFARALGVGVTAVSGWERGAYPPKANNFLKLSALPLEIEEIRWCWQSAGMPIEIFELVAEKMLDKRQLPSSATDLVSIPPLDESEGDRADIVLPRWMISRPLAVAYLRAINVFELDEPFLLAGDVIVVDRSERDLTAIEDGSFLAVWVPQGNVNGLFIGWLKKERDKRHSDVTHLSLWGMGGPQEGLPLMASSVANRSADLVFPDSGLRVLGRVIAFIRSGDHTKK